MCSIGMRGSRKGIFIPKKIIFIWKYSQIENIVEDSRMLRIAYLSTRWEFSSYRALVQNTRQRHISVHSGWLLIHLVFMLFFWVFPVWLPFAQFCFWHCIQTNAQTGVKMLQILPGRHLGWYLRDRQSSAFFKPILLDDQVQAITRYR